MLIDTYLTTMQLPGSTDEPVIGRTEAAGETPSASVSGTVLVFFFTCLAY